MNEEKEPKKVVKAAPRVYAVNPPFLDLITNTVITGEPVEMVIHPWLQAQIETGKLKLV